MSTVEQKAKAALRARDNRLKAKASKDQHEAKLEGLSPDDRETMESILRRYEDPLFKVMEVETDLYTDAPPSDITFVAPDLASLITNQARPSTAGAPAAPNISIVPAAPVAAEKPKIGVRLESYFDTVSQCTTLRQVFFNV